MENWSINMISLRDWKDYYQSLFTEDYHWYQLIWRRSDKPSQIGKILITMKNGWSSEPRGVPPEPLKNGSDTLMQLLAYVFKIEELPQECKTEYISNLYKKAYRKQYSNYRWRSVPNSVSIMFASSIFITYTGNKIRIFPRLDDL